MNSGASKRGEGWTQAGTMGKKKKLVTTEGFALNKNTLIFSAALLYIVYLQQKLF